jgi:hypothetical protein
MERRWKGGSCELDVEKRRSAATDIGRYTSLLTQRLVPAYSYPTLHLTFIFMVDKCKGILYKRSLFCLGTDLYLSRLLRFLRSNSLPAVPRVVLALQLKNIHSLPLIVFSDEQGQLSSVSRCR